jgi:uncharacterized ubiquitin-like protein YukD
MKFLGSIKKLNKTGENMKLGHRQDLKVEFYNREGQKIKVVNKQSLGRQSEGRYTNKSMENE